MIRCADNPSRRTARPVGTPSLINPAALVMKRKSVAPSTGGSPIFQTMPCPLRQVFGITHQHGGIFEWWPIKPHVQERVSKCRCHERQRQHPVVVMP